MTALPAVDPSTPVLVGVGQVAERIDDAEYRGLSPVQLAAAAADRALEDAGAADRDAVRRRVDTVAGVRQFEISGPEARAPLGRSDNFPRSVADRLGIDPRHAILEVAGGQSPQHLVTEMCRRIAGNDGIEVALVFGSEAISTVRHLAGQDVRPDFTEHRGGPLDDRGYGLSGLVQGYLTRHGLADNPSQYALCENARRSRLGLSRQEYLRRIGELFAPFTGVAAKNPLAAAPVERTAEELTTVTERNRMIADPYPRFVVARDQVNQGAAVLVMSVRAAQELGISSDKWVFLHGHADLRERPLLERPDLGVAPASVHAARHALEVAGIDAAALSTIDLYSCFPIAVFNICDGLGLSPADPRGLTVTGGLPFFGGAGNNYSLHAIAETVTRLRARPGDYGFVGANGGTLSKYSAAVYSTTPVQWREDRSELVQADLDAVPTPVVAQFADGWATIETYTVQYTRDRRTRGIVVGRLDDGRRFLATTLEHDTELVELLTQGEPLGHRVFVRSTSRGNRVALSRASMNELSPPRRPGLRDDYEHVLVSRQGRVLEVTINRPEARNALTPQANEELDEIFDGFFADPELWVAILTGAGDKAFSAGNDLKYSASGKPMWTPKNGFAGLTSRREMDKPVIAAVNGFAMGGGCEIALACHLVVADPSARFALSEVNVGLVAAAGGLVRLPRAIPVKLATEMILTGEQISADTAHRYGLVNRVSRPGAVLEEARELAQRILSGSPTSVRASLAVMRETSAIADVVDAVLHPAQALDDLMNSDDMREGMTAFAEKRLPRWRNR
ncbi:acetyl-CoA acetyltransferase [Nocardia sp. R7R-8]|uniref:acetyl-CoA acetyltransferase n=1 Tax=Nocardia sp. R7R-8 TaxID=3459304 RepID=UPI00403E1A63